MILNVDKDGSDKTSQMCRLIWASVVCTSNKIPFLILWLVYFKGTITPSGWQLGQYGSKFFQFKVDNFSDRAQCARELKGNH